MCFMANDTSLETCLFVQYAVDEQLLSDTLTEGRLPCKVGKIFAQFVKQAQRLDTNDTFDSMSLDMEA